MDIGPARQSGVLRPLNSAVSRHCMPARLTRDPRVLGAYLERRRIARRVFLLSLVGFIAVAIAFEIAGLRHRAPTVVAIVIMAIGLVAVSCELFLRLSRCPRCGSHFVGRSIFLQTPTLLTDKYLSCQNCRLSEQDLSGGVARAWPVTANKTLQRSGNHKVLARGQRISSSVQGALARTTARRAAAELCR